nr:AfsR/SARP family transcriptional regulator [Micromonospora sp. DSM 115978]
MDRKSRSTIGDAVEIRLLGPVEAWSDGGRLDLGPRQQRFGLAVLALEVNHLVSVGRLVDLTWPTGPPRTARHAVQVNISRLRAVLRATRGAEAVALTTQGDGYALRGDPLIVDAHLFRDLLGRARRSVRDTDRVSLLRQALALWRGPALAGVGAPEITDTLTRGLTEERLAAEEECVDAELRAGNHLGVLGGLVELVARHPHRQRSVAQLMIAQYRAGLTADALATYRSARTAMARDIGLDPGRHLRDLEQAILRGDPGLDAARQRDHIGYIPAS